MDFETIFMFFGTAFLSCFTVKNFAIGMIKEIGTNRKYYPKSYAIPPRWIRKIFKLEKREIAKFIRNDLVVSLFFGFLGPLNTLIFFASNRNAKVAGVLFMLHICMILLDFIYVSIMYFVFKKK